MSEGELTYRAFKDGWTIHRADGVQVGFCNRELEYELGRDLTLQEQVMALWGEVKP